MKVFFVRHGETVANTEGVAAGGTIDTPLTEKGKEQAKATATHLKNRKVSPDVILSSTLSRARETARIIAKEIGFSGEVVTDQLWNERNLGELAGIQLKALFEKPDRGDSAAGIETTNQLFERTERALRTVATLDAQCVIVVSHGGMSRFVKAIINDLDRAKVWDIEEMKNAQVMEFEL